MIYYMYNNYSNFDYNNINYKNPYQNIDKSIDIDLNINNDDIIINTPLLQIYNINIDKNIIEFKISEHNDNKDFFKFIHDLEEYNLYIIKKISKNGFLIIK